MTVDRAQNARIEARRNPLPAEQLPRDPCPTCGGDGEVLVRFVFGVQIQDCPDCDGPDCDGPGTVDD